MRAVDLFSGWGGFSLGAEQAGVRVVWAGNHWTLAVEAHSMNHPQTIHVCQDLRQADWSLLPDYEILLASPACQGHSSASQPKRRRYHDNLRATAWAVVDCADQTTPEILVVENVPSFKRWRLYEIWCEALRTLGYELQERIIRASHHGVPQRRDRLFLIGSLEPLELQLEPTPEPAIGPYLEDDGPGWRSVAEASEAVRGRIQKGRRNHGRRFITQHVTGHPGISLDDPIRTITTQDQFALVDGDQYRPLTIRETARAMGFPDDYTWPPGSTRTAQIQGLGNAVCPPVAKALLEGLVELREKFRE